MLRHPANAEIGGAWKKDGAGDRPRLSVGHPPFQICRVAFLGTIKRAVRLFGTRMLRQVSEEKWNKFVD